MVFPDSDASLLAHMEGNGLRPKTITWDGKPHRFPGRNQQRGTNGWVVAFPDRFGAVYGDWREPDTKYHWRAAGRQVPWDGSDRAYRAARKDFEREKERRGAEREERYANAAQECEQIWKAADANVPRDFPYLVTKGLSEAPGLRVAEKGGEQFLIVRMLELDRPKIQSLQWIAKDGTKKNHPGARAKGGRYVIAPDAFREDGEEGTFYICEGWATAVSIHLAKGCTVVIAFTAGNLARVTVHYRKRYRQARIIVCADNDRYSANGKGKHNPGVTAARKAVRAAREAVPGSKTDIAIPDFESLEGNPTDFDDLRQREGPGTVRTWLDPNKAAEAETRAPPPADKLIIKGVTAKELQKAFNHFGIEVRYDLRGQAVQYRLSELLGIYPAKTWIPADDRLEAVLQERIKAGCVTDQNRSPGFIRSWLRLVNAIVAERQVDPFEEFLESVPDWDGKERLHMLLGDLFQADADNPLVAWAGRYIFLGIIQRTKQPGCKLREFPVLIGPQGCGKSALLRNIFPKANRDTWYGELNMSKTPKQRVEALLRRAVVELAEMAGINKADIPALKSFLTLEDDGSVRLSYDRRPSNLPRRCAFVGTSNDPYCLPSDVTGNTRFVAITLNGGSHVEAFLDAAIQTDGEEEPGATRDQLWAEALHLYREGERANLPRGLYGLQATVNLAATARPAELQDPVAKLDTSQLFTYREVAEKLKLVPKRSDGTADYSQLGRQRKDIREAMHAAGWVFKRQRRDGKLEYLWSRTDDEKPSETTS